MKNLVFKPASELGRFKFIFSKRLREEHFDKVNNAKMEIRDDKKIQLGQISKVDVQEFLRERTLKEVIDIVWDRAAAHGLKYESKEEFAK